MGMCITANWPFYSSLSQVPYALTSINVSIVDMMKFFSRDALRTNGDDISIMLDFVLALYMRFSSYFSSYCYISEFIPILSFASRFFCFFSKFLVRSEFIFINPNSKGQCGCGESFMTTTNTGAA